MHFNWLDIILLTIFIFSIIGGIARGFVNEVISLVVLVIAFAVATLFSTKVAAYFSGSHDLQSVVTSASSTVGLNPDNQISMLALGLSFLCLFLGTLITGTIIKYFLARTADLPGLNIINRLLGGLFGVGRGLLINLVIIGMVQMIPQAAESDTWSNSLIVTNYQPIVPWFTQKIEPSLASLHSKISKLSEKETLNND